MSFRTETADDNGRGHVEEKKGKSVATANAEEGNGVAHEGSNGINLAAKDNGSRLAVSQESPIRPIHQSKAESEGKLQSEVHISIDRLLKRVSPSNLQNHKIFKGHHNEEDKKFYVPSIISIGPYYHGEKHLEAMETHKVHFLKKLIERQEKGLDQYVRTVISSVEEARNYYLDIPPEWKEDKVFSKMMLLDGCFIVELSCQLREGKLDATVSDGGRLTSILHDLALVENQLPFFVLWKLLGISVAGDEAKCECIQLLLSTFERKMPGVKTFNMQFGDVTNVKHLVDLLHSLWSPSGHNDKEKKEVDDEERKCISSITKDMNCGKLTTVKHLVDLLHSLWSPSGKKEVDEEQKWTHINSASELIEAGIQFKKVEEGSLFDIKFKNGKFKIPSMIIEDRTESLYHNIIAYERHSMLIEGSGAVNRYSARAKLTFYCRLMDCLINSENDVQILRKHRIIVNCLGDDVAVAQMFNRLGVHVGHFSTHGFFYAPLFNKVNKYYKHWWHKAWTTLWRVHLKSPWAFIPASAAFMLLVLSVLQTQYAIFPRASKGG